MKWRIVRWFVLRYGAELLPPGRYVMKNKDGHYLTFCHTTGSPYFTPDKQEAIKYGGEYLSPQHALLEMACYKSIVGLESSTKTERKL